VGFKSFKKEMSLSLFLLIRMPEDSGVFVPFFGRYASTAKGPAVFALRAGCPVYASFCSRQKDGRYIATFQEIEKARYRRRRKGY
jgi:lauroyl/myristoyl acyltransferase